MGRKKLPSKAFWIVAAIITWGTVNTFLALPAQATILLGKKGPGDLFTVLPQDDKRFELFYHELENHEWPSIEEQAQILRNPRIEPHKIVEEEVIEAIIKHNCSKNGVRCDDFSTLWVPPTLWDLSILVSNLDYHTRALKCAVEDALEETESETRKANLFACLQAEVQNTLEANGCPLSTLKNAPASFSRCVENLIRSLEHRSNEILSHHAAIGQRSLARRFLQKFNDDIVEVRNHQPTFISQIVQEEIAAHEKNQVVLWRATKGVEVKSLFEWSLPNPGPTPPPALQLTEYCKKEADLATRKWLRPVEGEKILDSAISFLGSISPKSLSFANSPLAGILFDGKSTASACSFSYVRPDEGYPYPFLYRISLDRNFFYSRNKLPAISPGALPYWFGVFGRGEKFHPHTMFYNEGDQRGDTSNSVNRKVKPTEDQVFKKARILSRIFASEQTRLIYVTDPNSPLNHLKSLSPKKVSKLNDQMSKAQSAVDGWLRDFSKCR